MSKLFKVKSWATAQQALDFLSIQLGEAITPVDVLQLVIEQKLKISVKLERHHPAKIGKILSFKDVPRRELPNLRGGEVSTFLDGYCLTPDEECQEDTPFACFDSDIVHIDGIWDLAMIGSEAIDVANLLQKELDLSELDLINIDGTFLCRPDGTFAHLHERYDPKISSEGYFPAGELPENSLLVFRTAELNRFVSELSDSGAAEKPLETKERNTLLCIIGVLCHEAGHDISKHAKAASAIQSMAAQMGVSIGESTIEGHLKKVTDALAGRTR